MYEVAECFNIIEGLAQFPKYTKLVFDAKAFLKLMCYVHLIGNYEISGFGRIQNGKIVDVKILRQKVRSATVDSDEIAIAEFMRSVPVQELPEWELDWHSHVNMAAHPSGVDWANYASMQELRMGKQYPILVINKSGDYTCKNYINEYRAPDIEVVTESDTFSREELIEIYNQCRSDIQELCTLAPTPIYNNYINTTKRINQFKNDYSNYSSNHYEGYTFSQDCCEYCGVELTTDEELSQGYCAQCALIMQ